MPASAGLGRGERPRAHRATPCARVRRGSRVVASRERALAQAPPTTGPVVCRGSRAGLRPLRQIGEQWPGSTAGNSWQHLEPVHQRSRPRKGARRCRFVARADARRWLPLPPPAARMRKRPTRGVVQLPTQPRDLNSIPAHQSRTPRLRFQPAECARVALCTPVPKMRAIQPLAPQQRADLTRPLAVVGLTRDRQLVLAVNRCRRAFRPARGRRPPPARSALRLSNPTAEAVSYELGREGAAVPRLCSSSRSPCPASCGLGIV